MINTASFMENRKFVAIDPISKILLDIAFKWTFNFMDQINNKIHQNVYCTNYNETTVGAIFLKVEFAVLEKGSGTILWWSTTIQNVSIRGFGLHRNEAYFVNSLLLKLVFGPVQF